MHHRGLDVEQREVRQHMVQAPRSAADGRGSQHCTDVLQVGAEMSGGEQGDGADRRRQRAGEGGEEQRDSNDQRELDEDEEHGDEQARVGGGRLPRAAQRPAAGPTTATQALRTPSPPITARFTRTVSTSPAYLPITSSDRRTGFASRL